MVNKPDAPLGRCPHCNANMDMVGRAHRCVPLTAHVEVPEKLSNRQRATRAVAENKRSRIVQSLEQEHAEEKRELVTTVDEAPAKRKRGRPKQTTPGFDKKTYQREYKRRMRAKLKEGGG